MVISKEIADRLRALAELALHFFTQQDYSRTRLQSLQPPRCNGTGRGVHSVTRSDFEQQSFAHIVLPLGALPSLLGDVGSKDKNIADNAHNTSAANIGTDYVVIRRRRVRLGVAMTLVCCGSLASVHSPQACKSVSRVCIMSYVTACSLFLTQVCKHRSACVFPTSLLTVLARTGAIFSVSIRAAGNSLTGQRLGFPRLSWVSVAAGRVSAER